MNLYIGPVVCGQALFNGVCGEKHCLTTLQNLMPAVLFMLLGRRVGGVLYHRRYSSRMAPRDACSYVNIRRSVRQLLGTAD